MRVLPAHPVRIDDQDRVPTRDLPHASARFWMHAEERVAVQIEEVMIPPAPGRIAGMLQRLVIHIGCQAATLGNHLEETVAPVRVLQRIDDHHHFFQQLRHARIVRGDEMVKHGERGVRTFRFIAVNCVTQPRDGQKRLNDFLRVVIGNFARVAEPRHAVLDFVEAREVLRRGDDQVMKRPVFVRARVFDQSRAVGRRGRPRLEALLNFDRVRRALADGKAEQRITRWHRGAVSGAGEEGIRPPQTRNIGRWQWRRSLLGHGGG